MKKYFILLLLFIVMLAGCNGKDELNNVDITFNSEMQVEVNSKRKISEFVKVTNGTLINGDDVIDTSKVGNVKVEINVSDAEGKDITKSFTVSVVDTTPPVVEGVKDLSIKENEKIDFYKNLTITDNSNEEVTKEIKGNYDLSKEGTYNLKYVIKDPSGNETAKDFKLVVKKVTTTTIVNNKSDYYIKVNKTQNVVMVYAKDDNGEYTKLVKTFVASAGNNTPIGTFNTAAKYETLALVGGVYGHYTVQIHKAIWFHSVPYYTKPDKQGNWNNLEYEEYNKLGNLASKGCVRLAVRDSKWIYDNIPKGTTVEIYESDTLPEGVTKPVPIKIDINDTEKRGWDPTDINPNSPWNS